MPSQVKMVSETSSIFMATPIGSTYGRFLWEPSQRGALPLCLQPQNETIPVSVASNFTGLNPVPLWEPSQSGCLPLLPQAHHQYALPNSTSILYEPFWATSGSDSDIGVSPLLFAIRPNRSRRSPAPPPPPANRPVPGTRPCC